VHVSLDGKLALVTGASRGIGRATALALASAGADVVVNHRRSAEAATAVHDAIEALGRNAWVVQADVASAEDVSALFERVAAIRGRLDILVNNAGLARDALLGSLELSDWNAVVGVNLGGTFLCSRAALPLMLPHGSGKIVNVASVAALRANRGQAAYAAAKGGVVAFTRACAVELARKGIQVNAVLPGMVETEMSARVRRNAGDELLAAIPARRFGTAEEVAGLVTFLASSHADYITGQAVVIDGGASVA
jgi:3-oxoacyl-[acyl-carrier protein] reductase